MEAEAEAPPLAVLLLAGPSGAWQRRRPWPVDEASKRKLSRSCAARGDVADGYNAPSPHRSYLREVFLLAAWPPF